VQAEAPLTDDASSTQFYRVTLLDPLKPKAQQTLSINYNVLSALKPLPAAIGQNDKQYLQFAFSEYAPSAYAVAKQKTKVKFPSSDVPDSTGKPEKQGSTYTYGTFSDIPAGAESPQTARYEFTKPLIVATLLERDVEVSHWGGNAAFEERYWLTNAGASLAKNFDRVSWATQQYYNPVTSAIKGLAFPMRAGSIGPYYTDEIGNVSTSSFRAASGKKEGRLEIKPRYPVFGGWSHPFRVGWDNELSSFLRHLATGGYILNVPFFEGPKMAEGVSYDKVVLRIILPEGAT
jgi:oligosaccharyltransferase complex subunit alpha (ribophorin I)